MARPRAHDRLLSSGQGTLESHGRLVRLPSLGSLDMTSSFSSFCQLSSDNHNAIHLYSRYTISLILIKQRKCISTDDAALPSALLFSKRRMNKIIMFKIFIQSGKNCVYLRLSQLNSDLGPELLKTNHTQLQLIRTEGIVI